MNLQLSLFEVSPPPRPVMPEGFAYQPDLIDEAEERDLVARFQGLDFQPYEHLGHLGHRRVAGFGWRRDDHGHMVETGEPIPYFLRPLLAKVAGFTGLTIDSFRHALVTEYAPGAGIGWHRDRPPAGRGYRRRLATVALRLPPAPQGRRPLGPRDDPGPASVSLPDGRPRPQRLAAQHPAAGSSPILGDLPTVRRDR